MAKPTSGVANDEIEMNMTPMIDVVFQLLIFFMLLTGFTSDKITLELASMKTAEQTPTDSSGGWRTININRSGEIFLGKTLLGPGNDKRTWVRFLNELDTIVRQGDRDAEGNSMVRFRLRPDLGAKWCYMQMVEFCLSREKIFKIQISANMPFEWEQGQ